MIVHFTNEANLKLEPNLNQEVGPIHTLPYPILPHETSKGIPT